MTPDARRIFAASPLVMSTGDWGRDEGDCDVPCCMIISVGTGETGELYALLCHYVMLYGVPCDMNVVLYYTGYNKGWCSFNMISECTSAMHIDPLKL